MPQIKILAYCLFAVLVHLHCYSVHGVSQQEKRECVYRTASSQIGVREATGRNDGAAVKKYLATVGLREGYAWCAAFVNWCLEQCEVKTPRSAWVPAWLDQKRIVYDSRKAFKVGYSYKVPQRCDLIFIWDRRNNRPGHIGLVENWGMKYVITIEGNTNTAGSREGDGVYRKVRPINSIFAVVDIISL